MKKYAIMICCSVFFLLSCVWSYISSAANSASDKEEIPLEAYGDTENLFYVSKDYVVDGRVALKQGYYESVNIQGISQNVFIPIAPQTHERLPSDEITDGTLLEIDGKQYIVHVSDSF